MPDLKDKYSKLEIMPVLISAGQETKLLGVPSFTPFAGVAVGSVIGDFTMDLLDDWYCSADGAVSMVFDTTSTNTGLWTGGCVELQSKLNKPLLWCACRKHMGEVVAGKVFDTLLIEKSQSPDTKIFKNFRSNFNIIPQKKLLFRHILTFLQAFPRML